MQPLPTHLLAFRNDPALATAEIAARASRLLVAQPLLGPHQMPNGRTRCQIVGASTVAGRWRGFARPQALDPAAPATLREVVPDGPITTKGPSSWTPDQVPEESRILAAIILRI